MVKILHVGPVFDNRSSGPSNSILGLAKGMALNGGRIGLLPSEPPGINKESVPGNIALLPSPKARQLNPWKISDRWIDIIRENFGDPHIVNFHDTYIPFQTALASLCRKVGWPYVVTPRGGLTHLAQKIKPFKKKTGNMLFFNRFIKYAEKIHSLSENEASDIVNLFPNSRVVVIPNGIDEDLFSVAASLKNGSKKTNRGNNNITLGFVGRLDVYHKGLDLLLKAIKKVQINKKNNQLHLLLVGPYYRKKDEQQIKTMINELLYPENIKLTGAAYGDHKWKFLNSCDVFVHTSRFEGMPMAVLEAMAFGKPCMVTPGSNVQDLISESRGGWLCGANSDSISETLLNILVNKEEIKKRGENAERYAKKHLGWSNIADQWINKMSDLMTI
jgi:glycosyltransferase involved in cell wall biosynthesis